MQTKQEIIDLIRGASLSRVEDKLIELIQESIQITTHPVDEDDITIGQSKIGGRPDMPVSNPWPEWEGNPLSFIAQINLSDITRFEAAAQLPRSGLLSFFYDVDQSVWGFDPKEKDGWRVFYFPQETDLIRHETPEMKVFDSLERFEYQSCTLQFSLEYTLLSPLNWFQLESLELTAEERDTYFDLSDAFDESRASEWVHRMFGHSDNIQGDMQIESQLVSNGIYIGDAKWVNDPELAELKKGAGDWLLLLQVDTDENAKMMWGDSGRIFYWIHKDALKFNRFEDTWFCLQCY